PPATLSWPWRAGQPRPLARLVLEETPPAARSARARALAGAWAGLVFAVLSAVALSRRPGPVDARRLIAVLGGVIAARTALLMGRTLEELLPRTLGSPSLYGRGDMLGLCASP